MSFGEGVFPDSHKHALVWLRIKKPTLDLLDIKSFRPISNPSFVSKMTERLVVDRFNAHISTYHLLPPRQSAYRPYHSTETAIMIVHNDIIRAINAGNVSALVLLDLSAAFDTIDHDIVIEILNLRFGVVDYALNWFRSYFSGRTQSFCTPTGTSKPDNLNSSVPHGSVIGPQKFIAYTGNITDTIDVFSVDHHLYADDTQLQKHMHVCEIQANRQNLAQCVVVVGEWCSSRRLQLNPD